MKKLVILMSILAVALTFASCAKKECETCGSTDDVEKYEIAGDSAYLCETCRGLADIGKAYLGME
ncbi:MAG: hypothetical protein E7613_03090 [Ruminococcaceae bacterium]|nr:hypothetical protein [Oscillospiraceae bacterium]